MNANTEFDPTAIPENVSMFTPEDELLLEQLVDDELSEDDRDFVLARLDEIPEGWRLCALAFLENQSFRTAFREKSSLEVDTPLTRAAEASNLNASAIARPEKRGGNRKDAWFAYAISAAALVVCAAGVFKNDNVAPSSRKLSSRPAEIAFAEPLLEPANKDVFSLSENGGSFDDEHDSNSADAFALDYSKTSKQMSIVSSESYEADEFDSSVASLEVANQSPAGVDAGFGSGMASIPSGARAFDSKAESANYSNDSDQNSIGTRNLDSREKRVNSDFSIAESNSDQLDQTTFGSFTPRNKALDHEIRTVTLNCPQHGLTNVSASCVEGERYDPEFFRQTGLGLPEEIVGALNQEGTRIEKRRDEYRFSLGDGRVLILPIDAYDVKYVDQHIW